MLGLDRFAHPLATTRSACAPRSHLLRPRIGDLGASWSAHACRCRRERPDELAWAAPLLDPDDPADVAWAHAQAWRLVVWHNHLPTYLQVSFTCERLAEDRRAAGGR